MPPEIEKVNKYAFKSDLNMTTEEIHDFLRERDGDFCFTGQHDWRPQDIVTIEHWIPLSKGGTWAMENLRLACKRCNSDKGDRMPNPDGTLPPHPRDLLPLHQRRADKSGRVDVCGTCLSGRILLPGEQCPDCGSGPQPAATPRSTQKSPKDCSHGWEDPLDHCWMCHLGHVERRPAIETVLDTDRL